MTKKQKKVLYRIFASALIYAALLAAMHLWPGFSRLPFYVQVAAFGVPYLIIGFDVLYKAVRGIINLSPFDENLLMCIATIAAFAIGEFEESVAVMLFYQVGELFQSYAVGKSRESITDLMSIAPEYANIESDAGVEKVDPDDVGVGDIIVIRPGEKVPLDGEIIEGESFFDTSPLTGESVPRKAGVGDSVISGCINKDGTVRVRVQKEYEESTVARILELVEESSEKKAQLENFITRFARYYTPIVTLSALALAVIPPLVFGEPYGSWIHRACTFLIVSCPCALVISVPLGFFAGIGAASRDGILIKGGNYLEAACDATTFAFDKTGTLTKGEFNVRRVVVASDTGLTERELLMLAAAVENYSTHPIAGAIVSEAKKYHMPTDDISITAQREIAGRGIIAYVKYPGKDIEKVYVGNAALLNDEGISIDVDHLSGTVVCIGIDGEPAGVIVIDDQLKDEAVGSLKALRETGVEKLVLISGDKDEAAGRIARESNLDEYYAELLPADKIETLEKLMKENEGLTCYVGDGINDAPVLMRADLGIAMGAAGSDAAIEAADIVLMDDDLRKLPRLVRLAKRVRRIVRQNIVFAIGVKLIVLALGAVGVATLWAAVFADVGVAVLTILNSMRLLKR